MQGTIRFATSQPLQYEIELMLSHSLTKISFGFAVTNYTRCL
jgi:hypothetical protein